jgi:energy-coupling factor transporter ATP-binding protein EcfA2
VHSLIVGMTESGKSTLAKLLASELTKKKQKVVVLDPLLDSWDAQYVTDNVDELIEYLKKADNRECHVFVDESGEVFNEGRDRTYAFLTTRSRHYGHSVTLIGQRYIQLPKTMRDQCGRAYVFTQSLSDGQELSAEWNKPELLGVSQLPQLHFFVVGRYDPVRKAKIVNYKKVVFIANSAANSSNNIPVVGASGGVAKRRKMDKGTRK